MLSKMVTYKPLEFFIQYVRNITANYLTKFQFIPFQSSVAVHIETNQFAMQIQWLVSIWNATLGWNALTFFLKFT